MIYLSKLADFITQGLIQVNLWLSTPGCLILTAFFIMVLFILKLLPSKQIEPIDFQKSIPTMQSIAGEDVLTAQLDLARAYLEMGKQQDARNILKSVVQQGNAVQRQEAKQLLEKCK